MGQQMDDQYGYYRPQAPEGKLEVESDPPMWKPPKWLVILGVILVLTLLGTAIFFWQITLACVFVIALAVCLGCIVLIKLNTRGQTFAVWTAIGSFALACGLLVILFPFYPQLIVVGAMCLLPIVIAIALPSRRPHS